MTKHTISILAGALSLALSGAVAAEQQQSTTTSTSTTRTTETGKKDNHGQMVSSVASSKSQKQDFASIDSDGDGYIMVADLDDDSPLKVSFTTYDLDSDNKLSRSEYQSWFSSAGNVSSMTTTTETRQFTSIDTDNDGFIAVSDLDAGSPLVASFTTYDLDSDNKLSRTEYDAWIASVDVDGNANADMTASTHGSTVSGVAQTKRDFKDLDTDGDGSLSDAEWALAGVDADMTMHDADGDGALSESEYRQVSLASMDSDFDSELDTDADLDTDIDTDSSLDDSNVDETDSSRDE